MVLIVDLFVLGVYYLMVSLIVCNLMVFVWINVIWDFMEVCVWEFVIISVKIIFV